MKKGLLIALVMCMVLTSVAMPIKADENETNSNIIYLDNGYYITVELNVTDSRATSTKSGNKVYVFRNSNGGEEWRATLYGTFTYTGASSLCTSASCTVSITNTAWYTISNTYSKSGNFATADVVIGRKFLGIKIDEETISIRLTCDANGNLS